MAVSVCERPRSHFVPVAGPANTTKRADLVLLRQGLDIAVNYFNFGQRENIKKLTVDAKKWCVQYYKGYHYAPKRATGLLKTFPNLFNLEVESHLRIVRAVMEESGHSQPEGATPRQLRRAERKAANSEAFPEFEEPTLASDEEMDEIVELRPRRSPEQPKVKPEMRVDAAMLRGSGLLQQLPEFLGQLARANLETETLLATNPEAVRFELDDDVAEEQPHIEVDVFSGVAEAQQRRHARRVILPGGRPFKLPGDEEGTEGDDESEPRSTGNDSDDSGNESDASTSTVASLRIRHRKRKAGVMTEGNGDDESPPNKIRIQYQHPTHTLAAFDLTERKIVRKVNPLANVEADPFVHLTRKRKGDDTFLRADSPERPSSSGSSSSTSSNKRIKIKVVNHGSASNSSQASSPAPSDASSSLNSRPSTPEFKIIRVYDSGASSSSSSSSSGSPSSTRSSPRIKIPNSPGSSSTKSSPRIKIIRGGNRSVSPTMPLAVIDSERGPEQLARPSSSSSMDSSGSGKSIKIKLVGKYSPKILARR
ncbi:hypothetical protein V8F20_000492 [Naviculisporaceae sp. PSN 640]